MVSTRISFPCSRGSVTRLSTEEKYNLMRSIKKVKTGSHASAAQRILAEESPTGFEEKRKLSFKDLFEGSQASQRMEEDGQYDKDEASDDNLADEEAEGPGAQSS